MHGIGWSAVLMAVSLVACAAATQEETERLLVDVAPERRACMGEGPRSCLVVRWGGDTTWGNFYDEFAGYVHEPGTYARLLVERRIVPNPPADGGSFTYTLRRLCLRVAATGTNAPAPVAVGVAECR